MNHGPQRLFLGSAGLGALPAWIASLPTMPSRAALIPTAANPLPSAPYVRAAADLLEAEGMAVDRLDLEHAAPVDVQRVLDRVQVVFVAGGYALFLLQHVRRSGFDRLAAEAVRAGSLAYIGFSAGAALAGPDLSPLHDEDDPGAVTSTAGLGLVPFAVLAHRNWGRAARHDRLAADPDRPCPRVSINDDQAITVTDSHWQIQPSPAYRPPTAPPPPSRPR
ncbi:Type 1 glutamine amidotransferase-like domain-containing protein [Actinomadura fibrosa]|uniref:Type 1 glutamine amidotransferase-like domain-containing protein n=1 Tax=Actinomadura fibrosa TaxID=111802 RepID=A0ABW2XRV6_9ACTN|nr:Type 1 glutamine amidotransferase-like domain-containing protein [Actinomadura fibrosa]